MSKRVWYGTTDACQYLGIHRETVAKMRKTQLVKGKHWRVKNPLAKRLSYLYNVATIQQLQSEVVTEVPKTEPVGPVYQPDSEQPRRPPDKHAHLSTGDTPDSECPANVPSSSHQTQARIQTQNIAGRSSGAGRRASDFGRQASSASRHKNGG